MNNWWQRWSSAIPSYKWPDCWNYSDDNQPANEGLDGKRFQTRATIGRVRSQFFHLLIVPDKAWQIKLQKKKIIYKPDACSD